MNSRAILPSLIALLLSSVAHAGFYIAPYAGYHYGTIEYKVKSSFPVIGGATDKGTLNGPALGFAFGWRFDNGVIVGGDVQGAMLASKYEKATTTAKSTQTGGYFILGYQVRPEAQVYVGTGAMTSVDDQNPKNTVTGSAVKAGVSYEFKQHIALGAEWVLYTLTDSESSGTKIKLSDVYERFQYNGYLVNLRFPFTFGGK
jgi:opacity protein-like surface antigen